MKFLGTLISPLVGLWRLVFPKLREEVAELITALEVVPAFFEITPDPADASTVVIGLVGLPGGIQICMSACDIWLRCWYGTMQLNGREKVALNKAIDQWLLCGI